MSDNGSGMNAIVAIVAVIVIAAVAYFAVMMLRGEPVNDGPGINVNLGTDGGAQ
jgi:hypothetical protein